MAVMRPLKAITVLGISPLVLSSATCKNPNTILVRERASQCSFYSNQAASASFSFRLAASYSGKGTRYDPRRDIFHFHPHTGAPVGRLKASQRPNSGQDSYFVGDIDKTNDVALAIADGVGGWADSGIDPADFSHGLCEYMRMAAARAEIPEKVRPRDLLQTAYDATIVDETIFAGGSTACVAVGRENGVLEVANLGDSGFVQLRPKAVSYASEPQTHAFNTPYQLSLVPPEILARQRAFGGMPLMDLPVNASVTTHRVRHGDVLVFGSDGVWDNLSPSDVLAVVTEYMMGFQGWTTGPLKSSQSYSEDTETKATLVGPMLTSLTEDGGIGTYERTIQAMLAVAITGEAKIASLNQKRDGPFAREVKRHYPNEDWKGGKVDDICVVVAVVVQNGA